MTVEQKPDRLVQKLYKPTSSTRRRSSGFISMLTYHLERINSNVCELYALEVCRGRTIGSELQRVPKYDQTPSKLLEEPLGRQIIY
jgi:hypothetical protein